jgi:acetolactate synthase I/III small subunit
MVGRHTFVAELEDRPGVLNRVVSLFRRRAFNILSLNVGGTHTPGLSRMTVVVEADPDRARLLAANLRKLVEVRWVEDLSATPAVIRDLVLIKLEIDEARRPEVLQVAEVFRARVVDMSDGALTLEATGTQDKIDGLVAVLRPFGIAEMVQCGAMAMRRGRSERATARRARAA